MGTRQTEHGRKDMWIRVTMCSGVAAGTNVTDVVNRSTKQKSHWATEKKQGVKWGCGIQHSPGHECSTWHEKVCKCQLLDFTLENKKLLSDNHKAEGLAFNSDHWCTWPGRMLIESNPADSHDSETAIARRNFWAHSNASFR